MEPLSPPDPTGTGGADRMPAVNNVGEPCAGESHARFDGRVLETELLGTNAGLSGQRPPRQRSTLRAIGHECRQPGAGALHTKFPIRFKNHDVLNAGYG